MIADQTFYDICFTFFILRLWLRPTAEGRSLSGPNIRLRPKVKIAPTVQHCNSLTGITSKFRLEKLMLFIWYFFTFFGRNYADGRILIMHELHMSGIPVGKAEVFIELIY